MWPILVVDILWMELKPLNPKGVEDMKSGRRPTWPPERTMYHPEGVASVPYISLIMVDFVLLQNTPKFNLKCPLAMMLFLVSDVALHRIDVGLTDREYPIAILPGKLSKSPPLCLDPLGGTLLHLLQEPGNSLYSGKQAEDVDMIRNAAHLDNGATEFFTCAAQIRVHFIPNV